MKTAAVVIWTPGDPDPGPCLDSLAPQVDELVLTVNPGGSPSARGAEVITTERTLGFGANINRGVAATMAPYVVVSNPDIEVTPAQAREMVEAGAQLIDVREGYEHEAGRILEGLLDPHEEGHGFLAVDDAVVVGEREIHHRPGHNLPVAHHWALLDPVHAENA